MIDNFMSTVWAFHLEYLAGARYSRLTRQGAFDWIEHRRIPSLFFTTEMYTTDQDLREVFEGGIGPNATVFPAAQKSPEKFSEFGFAMA